MTSIFLSFLNSVKFKNIFVVIYRHTSNIRRMIKTKTIFKGAFAFVLVAYMAIGTTSCSKTQSYSELLRDEEEAVNWYLASQKVELDVPTDSISFLTGEDAPFYKLDEDGYVYMQVISKGDPDDRVQSGDLVYFRFKRLDIKSLYRGEDPVWVGNSADLSSTITDDTNYTRFVYENNYLSSTTQWGTGIQMPLKFFGYNSEVNLVLRSYYGFQSDQTSCIPYLINLRYFKPEY